LSLELTPANEEPTLAEYLNIQRSDSAPSSHAVVQGLAGALFRKTSMPGPVKRVPSKNSIRLQMEEGATPKTSLPFAADTNIPAKARPITKNREEVRFESVKGAGGKQNLETATAVVTESEGKSQRTSVSVPDISIEASTIETVQLDAPGKCAESSKYQKENLVTKNSSVFPLPDKFPDSRGNPDLEGHLRRHLFLNYVVISLYILLEWFTVSKSFLRTKTILVCLVDVTEQSDNNQISNFFKFRSKILQTSHRLIQ
jgi:hypothetical protein